MNYIVDSDRLQQMLYTEPLPCTSALFAALHDTLDRALAGSQQHGLWVAMMLAYAILRHEDESNIPKFFFIVSTGRLPIIPKS